MHLLLTDRLACPRCGPEFGLILLADRMGAERRVVEGGLGCANCRDTFPVRDGFADLRTPPRGALPPGRAGEPSTADEEEVGRMQALLGIAEGPGTVVCLGRAARLSFALAERIEGIAAVAIDADMARWPDAPGVSRIAARPGIPLFSRMSRGVVVDGTLGERWWVEAARVVAPLGRVVVVDAPPDTASALEAAGLSVLASEAGTVVAARG